jgi:hypothetical protein
MVYQQFDPDDPNASEAIRSMLSPQHVDQQIRQAIQFCWMVLPPEKRTVAEVEAQIRRIVDRALQDLRDDASSFGLGK